MSVDTYLKGKDLRPYKRVQVDDDLRVLVAPELDRQATTMRIETSGHVFKRFHVALGNSGRDGDACLTRKTPLSGS